MLIDRTIGHVHAVDDVSLRLNEGETLGVVGESGCGKSTLARCFVRLLEPTAGAIRYRGQDITHLSRKALDPMRREVQLVFQDPVSSLNPRKRVGQIMGTPAAPARDGRPQGGGARARPARAAWASIPSTSTGSRTSSPAASASASASPGPWPMDPQLIVLDEPVSALDVSIQAQVVNLLDDLQDDMGLSYVFIAHDLSVVRHVSDQIAVMYLGKLMELSPARELYTKPMHPYTEALLEAIPSRTPRRTAGASATSSGASRPTRSTLRPAAASTPAAPTPPKCAVAVEPPLAEYAGGHVTACHHPRNVTAAEAAAATRSPLSPLSAGEEMPSANGTSSAAPAPSAPPAASEGSESATVARDADDGGQSA